jgi:hypothetical protein
VSLRVWISSLTRNLGRLCLPPLKRGNDGLSFCENAQNLLVPFSILPLPCLCACHSACSEAEAQNLLVPFTFFAVVSWSPPSGASGFARYYNNKVVKSIEGFCASVPLRSTPRRMTGLDSECEKIKSVILRGAQRKRRIPQCRLPFCRCCCRNSPFHKSGIYAAPKSSILPPDLV